MPKGISHDELIVVSGAMVLIPMTITENMRLRSGKGVRKFKRSMLVAMKWRMPKRTYSSGTAIQVMRVIPKANKRREIPLLACLRKKPLNPLPEETALWYERARQTPTIPKKLN